MSEAKQSDFEMFTHILIIHLSDEILHTIRKAISDEWIAGWCPVCCLSQRAYKDSRPATEAEEEEGEGLEWREEHEPWCPAHQIDAHFAERGTRA